ncbi:hypothetical protein FB451DRAFT_1390953 [Mycena latifolia]|nr:hypothetical protein FB451DRAFT_1390953 [Mycena latifolia]
MGTHWGELPYLTFQPWGIPGYFVSTGITGAAVQIFLDAHVVQLWIWILVIGLFIAVGVAGAGTTAGTSILDSSISGREALVKYVLGSIVQLPANPNNSGWVTVWLSVYVAADTFITAILVMKFQSLKTAFVGTSDLLRRLSVAAVRNGSTTMTVTIITIVRFKLQPETNSALMLEVTSTPHL